MADSFESGQKVSKWGQRRRYLPSARFSTERLDLILAKLKGSEQEETSPSGRHKSQQDLSIQKEKEGSNAKSWNVYVHDSPFEKTRGIFEDLIAEKTEQDDSQAKANEKPKPKRLPTYDEFIKSSDQDTANSNTYDLKHIKDEEENANQSQLKKFEHDIDTVPTRDTELPVDTANTEDDTVSITSSGNDVLSRDGHHNDSGYHDDLNNDNGDPRKGVSFSIENSRRTRHKSMDNDSEKSATLPARGNRGGRDGFVSQAKTWWQNKQAQSSTEQFKPPQATQVIAHHSADATDTNNNTNRLYQKRQSASANHRRNQGQSPTRRSTTPQFKDRFSSAVVKTPEEKRAERKKKDGNSNSNAPPLSMQSTEAFRIWKLREELDNRTREAEAFAEEVEKQMPKPKSRPTTPTASRTRPRTPTSVRPTTPIDLRPMSPGVPRSDREGRRLPNTPVDRVLSPTPSENSRRVRPTTPSNDKSRNRPVTPNLDRLMQPTQASKARSTTPSKEYVPLYERNMMRPTTPTSMHSPDRGNREHRPVTPNRDRALSPSPQRQRSRTNSTEKVVQGRYEQNDARTNVQAPVSNRARARRVQPATPSGVDNDSPTRQRSRTPTRDGAVSPSALRGRAVSPGLRDRAISPALLERATSPSPVGISIRERSLIQAKMVAETPEPYAVLRSKSADILSEKADWPVAPPRRTRKRPGRMLPTPPEQQAQSVRPKSPFTTRPVTPSKDTGIPGEGEALEEPPRKDSILDISAASLDTSVFTSPESEEPPSLKSQHNNAISSLLTKQKQDTEKLHMADHKTNQNVHSDSQSKPSENPKAKDSAISKLGTETRKSTPKEAITPIDLIAKWKNAPPSNLSSSKIEIASRVPYRPTTPADNQLRAQTPTRSILKKTTRTPSSDEILLDDAFRNNDFNAASSPQENYEMYTQSLPRESTKRSAWNRSAVVTPRNLRRPSSSLDKRTSPSFENLGKALQESLSPLKNLGLGNDTEKDNDGSSSYKRESPRNKRDARRNTIEGLPSTMTVATTTLTLPHRRPKSKETVKWTPSSFKSNTLGQRLSRSSQDLRGSIFGSREDLTSPGKLTKSPSMEGLQSKSHRAFGGSSVSSRFRRFESMDALEILETGSMEEPKVDPDFDDSGPDFVQCEFFV